MSYFAEAIMPPPDWVDVSKWKWPEQRSIIARLPLEGKQVWYAAQDPQDLIDLSENKTFQKWWAQHYLLPLKFKRFIFWFKFW